MIMRIGKTMIKAYPYGLADKKSVRALPIPPEKVRTDKAPMTPPTNNAKSPLRDIFFKEMTNVLPIKNSHLIAC